MGAPNKNREKDHDVNHKGQTLTDESLCTFLCEVEAIINSRPITTAQSDPGDLEPLAPNHL